MDIGQCALPEIGLKSLEHLKGMKRDTSNASLENSIERGKNLGLD